MDLLVLGWLTLELTGSPFVVAVAAFCRAAPLMALGPVAGLVLDRVHAGRVLVASQSAALVVAAALAALFGAGRGAFTPLLVLEVGLGIAWAIDFTTRRTIVYALGAAESGFATMQTTIVLLAAPDALRGRMMGILSACIGTGPFGTLLVGFAASLAGAPGAVAVAAGAAFLLMLPVGGPMILRSGRPPDAPR